MNAKGFTNEFQRALARPDVEELRRIAAEYFAWHQATRNRDPKAEELVVDPWIDSPPDPDWRLAFVALVMAEYDDPSFLGLVAAGPLEDLMQFQSYSEETLARILDEARKTPRFRWMLSGVWLHAIHPEYAAALPEAMGDMSLDRGDPVPPRPWA